METEGGMEMEEGWRLGGMEVQEGWTLGGCRWKGDGAEPRAGPAPHAASPVPLCTGHTWGCSEPRGLSPASRPPREPAQVES